MVDVWGQAGGLADSYAPVWSASTTIRGRLSRELARHVAALKALLPGMS